MTASKMFSIRGKVCCFIIFYLLCLNWINMCAKKFLASKIVSIISLHNIAEPTFILSVWKNFLRLRFTKICSSVEASFEAILHFLLAWVDARAVPFDLKCNKDKFIRLKHSSSYWVTVLLLREFSHWKIFTFTYSVLSLWHMKQPKLKKDPKTNQHILFPMSYAMVNVLFNRKPNTHFLLKHAGTW